jgi:hypothetical protein
MATRRPIFYRKEKPRSISKTGLLLCLVLAGGVMLVPAGGDAMQAAKRKLRDYALSSGLINFEDCVVTAGHALRCDSHATGVPLAVALRLSEDNAAAAAAEKEQRQKAEKRARELALDVERLNDALKQARRAANDDSYLAPAGGDKRTGLTITNPGTGSLMTSTTAVPHPAPAHDMTPAASLAPPADPSLNTESALHD